jgi:hypothetical protein
LPLIAVMCKNSSHCLFKGCLDRGGGGGGHSKAANEVDAEGGGGRAVCSGRRKKLRNVGAWCEDGVKSGVLKSGEEGVVCTVEYGW